MTEKAIQKYYPDEYSHCFGCGHGNPDGHHLESFWRGGEAVATFQPRDYHTALPGFVYGGLLASLIDCHGTATAAAACHEAQGRTLGEGVLPRFVTASLAVDYRAPTPMGPVLELRGRPLEVAARKVVVEIELSADDVLCAEGKVVAVMLPDSMLHATKLGGQPT